MQPLTDRAPVPYAQQTRLRAIGRAGNDHGRSARQAFELAASATRLESSAEVERFLPDILGRALARCWIDPEFRDRFFAEPREILARHKIELPAMIEIEVVRHGQTRPMVVVSERQAFGAGRRRLLYLQLVMVAGK